MSPKQFYAKYVKTCKKLRKVELPSIAQDTNVRVEQSLIDWRIYYTPWGRKQETHISCNSELEARYLSVWMKYGVSRIEIPRSEKDLEKIVPLLEKLEKQVTETLEEDLVGYKPKTQRAVVQGIWEVSSVQ